MNEKKLPVVAIVGRPNVGKSSLFNAIVGRRMSIVHEMSGVTRDRIIAPAHWRGHDFQLIDTGGIGLFGSEKYGADSWDGQITHQACNAIDDADVLIWVTNVQDGIAPLDAEAADRARSSNKFVIPVANKCDNAAFAVGADEMTAFGFGEPERVSCLHRIGIADLLDRVVAAFPQSNAVPDEADEADEKTETADDKPFRIAIVGRPNVGKSSLVNALLGEERVLVSDEAGTTRDAIDIDFQLVHQDTSRHCVLVDTAGLRKKAKVKDAVEMFSVMRAQQAVEHADFVLFLVESSADGMTAQDRRIAAMVRDSGKACVIVSNKIDTCDGQKQKALLSELRRTLPGLDYAPVVFISAREKRNLGQLLDQIAEIMELMQIKVSTSMVNQVVLEAFQAASPPVVGNAPLKIYYGTMVSNSPPKFLLFVNEPKYCAPNYLVYLTKAIRQAFDFTGLPLEIQLRARPKKVASFHTPKQPSGNRGHAKKRRKSVK